MRLYYFTGQKYALDAIQNRRLKIARIEELNDPFELMAPIFETRDERLAVDRWRKQMSERYGMLCMSTDWHHPLLWGHYADKSKGICLGFDTLERRKFSKVHYAPERSPFTVFGLADLGQMNEPTMKRMLHQKFDAWQYEAEYRSFTDLKEPDPESGLYFADFAPTLRLAQVIVGYRSTATRAAVAEAIGELTDVEVFKSRPGFQRFEVVRNMNGDAWE